jgi:hypothetical protein
VSAVLLPQTGKTKRAVGNGIRFSNDLGAAGWSPRFVSIEVAFSPPEISASGDDAGYDSASQQNHATTGLHIGNRSSVFQVKPRLSFTPDGFVYELDAPLGAISGEHAP